VRAFTRGVGIRTNVCIPVPAGRQRRLVRSSCLHGDLVPYVCLSSLEEYCKSSHRSARILI